MHIVLVHALTCMFAWHIGEYVCMAHSKGLTLSQVVRNWYCSSKFETADAEVHLPVPDHHQIELQPGLVFMCTIQICCRTNFGRQVQN